MLAWSNGANTQRVRIERSRDGTSFLRLITLDPAATSYRDGGLEPGDGYAYRLRAANAGGDSAGYSTVVTGSTLLELPAAPTDLTVAALSTTLLRVQWKDRSVGESGWAVERKAGALADGSGFAPLAVLNSTTSAATGGTVTYGDTSGLTANSVYTYRVRAFTGASGRIYSAYCSPAAGVTLPNVPAMPAGFRAAAASATQVNLVWTRDTSVSGYRLDRRTSSTGFVTVAVLSPLAAGFSDTGLVSSTTYTYQLIPLGFSNNGPPASDTTTTPAAASALEGIAATLPAPSNLSAQVVSTGTIRLTWQDNSTTETGFQVERKNGGPASTADYGRVGTTAANRRTLDDTVGAGNTYTYRVRAFQGSTPTLFSPYSNETSVLTPAFLKAPVGLIATAVPGPRVALSWNGPTGCTFDVERTSGTAAFARIANVTTSQFTDGGVLPNATYTYQVRAVRSDAAGRVSSDPSAPAQVTLRAPVAPANLVIRVPAAPTGSRQLTLSWQANGTDQTGFLVERKTGSGQYVTVAKVIAASYADTGLTPGTAYTYQVRATNTSGDSAVAGPANGTTLPGPPPPPSGLRVTALSARQVDLQWNALTDGTRTGFLLLREQVEPPGTPLTIGPLAGTLAGYQDRNNIQPGTSYRYLLLATGPGGRSEEPPASLATTPPERPGIPVPSGSLTPAGRVRLTWPVPSPGATQYRIVRQPGFSSGTSRVVPSTSFEDPETSPNTLYTYQVAGQVVAGGATIESALSNGVRVSTLGGTPVVLPDLLDFSGSTSANQVQFRNAVLKNTGSGTLRITSLAFLNGTEPDARNLYTLAGPPAVPYDLGPEQQVTLTVQFRRTGAGNFPGRLRIGIGGSASQPDRTVNVLLTALVQ